LERTFPPLYWRAVPPPSRSAPLPVLSKGRDFFSPFRLRNPPPPPRMALSGRVLILVSPSFSFSKENSFPPVPPPSRGHSSLPLSEIQFSFQPDFPFPPFVSDLPKVGLFFDTSLCRFLFFWLAQPPVPSGQSPPFNYRLSHVSTGALIKVSLSPPGFPPERLTSCQAGFLLLNGWLCPQTTPPPRIFQNLDQSALPLSPRGRPRDDRPFHLPPFVTRVPFSFSFLLPRSPPGMIWLLFFKDRFLPFFRPVPSLPTFPFPFGGPSFFFSLRQIVLFPPQFARAPLPGPTTALVPSWRLTRSSGGARGPVFFPLRSTSPHFSPPWRGFPSRGWASFSSSFHCTFSPHPSSWPPGAPLFFLVQSFPSWRALLSGEFFDIGYFFVPPFHFRNVHPQFCF